MAVGSGSNAPQRYRESAFERTRRANTIDLMLAEDLAHCAGWVDFAGSRCFQIIEAQKPSLRWRSGESEGGFGPIRDYPFPDLSRLLVKSNSGALFIAKRHNGIYARGTVGGHEAGQSCDGQEKY